MYLYDLKFVAHKPCINKELIKKGKEGTYENY